MQRWRPPRGFLLRVLLRMKTLVRRWVRRSTAARMGERAKLGSRWGCAEDRSSDRGWEERRIHYVAEEEAIAQHPWEGRTAAVAASARKDHN